MGGSQRRRAAIHYIQPCFVLWYSKTLLPTTYPKYRNTFRFIPHFTRVSSTLSWCYQFRVSEFWPFFKIIRKRKLSCCKHKLVAGYNRLSWSIGQGQCQVPVYLSRNSKCYWSVSDSVPYEPTMQHIIRSCFNKCPRIMEEIKRRDNFMDKIRRRNHLIFLFEL